ncbi:MAG: efflux RND transporter periplasmic adaptor subunit [Gemmatimonadota bacterium]
MNIDRRLSLTAALASVAGASALVLTGCGGGEGSADARAAAPGDSAYSRVINVEVRPVEETSFTERIRLTGTAQANQDVTVSAEESGRIEEILVEKGTPVRQGQPLMRVDASILRAQVEQARARALLAEEVWQRRKRLYEDEEVGSAVAYLEARATAEETAANLEALEERVDRTVIRAPFDGILDDRIVELGEMVSPGTRVARVVELDLIEVSAGVPERYAPDVERGSLATVSFPVLPDRSFESEVTYVGSTVNPQNRTFEVEFTLENPNRVVKPEMVANISVVRQTRENAVVVPQESLIRTESGFRAFVVDESEEPSVARARDVEVGPAQENRVVIEGGLSPGDLLVVVGQQQVAEGDRVRIVESRDRPTVLDADLEAPTAEERMLDPEQEPESWRDTAEAREDPSGSGGDR